MAAPGTNNDIPDLSSLLCDNALFESTFKHIKYLTCQCIASEDERRRIGSNHETWTLLNNYLRKLPDVVDSSSSRRINLIYALELLLRNCVAGVPATQERVLHEGFIDITTKLILTIRETSEIHGKALRACVQFISNAATLNSNVRQACADRWLRPGGLIWLSHALTEDKTHNTITSILVLLNNVLTKDPSICLSFLNLDEGKIIFEMILSRAWEFHDEEESQNFELLCNIVASIIDHGLWSSIYNDMLQSPVPQSTIKLPQYSLIMMLDAQYHKDNNTVLPIHDLLAIYIDLAAFVKNALISIADASSIVIKDLSPDVLTTFKAFTTMIELLIDIAMQDTYRFVITSSSAILKSTIDLLRVADEKLPKSIVRKSNITELDKLSEDNPTNLAVSLKKNSVQFIGTLAYEQPSVQEATRNLGGIGLVLAQCNIDDYSPFIREHALFAIRNLLHNNPENQNIVREMKPMEAVLNENFAADTGIQVSLDETGRPRLLQK